MSVLDLPISDTELEQYRDAINPVRHVRDITEFISDVVGPRFLGVSKPTGDLLPWEKAVRIGFRPAEVTLWHGINGHGKSAVTVQAALWWALQGKRSCIASFEMLPDRTVDRMLLQAAGSPSPSEEFAASFFSYLKGKIYLYDRRDRVDLPTLYKVVRYCAAEKQISHFWIDSLMKCVQGEDDYNGQKNLVDSLCTMARELGIHIHLVHHVRKGDNEHRIPGKFDARGAGVITDLVDNVICVWRNKAKEAERALGTVDEGKADFVLSCDKNRHGAWEGQVPLWGDVDCWHFRGTQQKPWVSGYEIPQ